mmetsp:Transcript_22997/g.26367  ORF Transcript_22997/g.26367 Transcript_22997/m.26367 type:complete len:161 (-) Transcript_22997:56-538(-)
MKKCIICNPSKLLENATNKQVTKNNSAKIENLYPGLFKSWREKTTECNSVVCNINETMENCERLIKEFELTQIQITIDHYARLIEVLQKARTWHATNDIDIRLHLSRFQSIDKGIIVKLIKDLFYKNVRVEVYKMNDEPILSILDKAYIKKKAIITFDSN